MREGVLYNGAVKTGWLFNFLRYHVNTTDSVHPRVHLTYDRDPEHQDYPVFLDATRPRFGGLRWWFKCPQCRQRAQKLFLPPRSPRFACRKCHRLSYASRSRNAKDRALTKAQAIRARLGGSESLFDPFPSKPVGMWWRTYDRLRDKHDHAEARSLSLLQDWLEERRYIKRANERS